MISVFLCGPFCLAPIAGVLGLEDMRAASLPDVQLVDASGSVLPSCRAVASGSIKGQIVAVDDKALASLAYLAEVFGWSLITRDIEKQEVLAMLPPAGAEGEPWQAANWTTRWGEIFAQALGELIELRHRRDPKVARELLHMVYARAASRVAASHPVAATVRAKTGNETVELCASEVPHAGFFLTRAYELRHPGFDGTMSPRLRREVFVATDAAIVLPYDPQRDRVLLVEQFRMGPFGRGDARPWILEPVAGRVDAGETPAETARRECEEEAGLCLRGLEHISSHYCTPGCSTEYFHLYLGLCDLPDVTQGQGGLDSEDEDIRTHVLRFEQAMQLLQSGEADNGPLVLSLLWLQRERARLRASA